MSEVWAGWRVPRDKGRALRRYRKQIREAILFIAEQEADAFGGPVGESITAGQLYAVRNIAYHLHVAATSCAFRRQRAGSPVSEREGDAAP